MDLSRDQEGGLMKPRLDAPDRGLLRHLVEHGPVPVATPLDGRGRWARVQRLLGWLSTLLLPRAALGVRDGRLTLVEPRPKRLRGASLTISE